MSLSTAAIEQIVKTYRRSKNDTGSTEVQVALLTANIAHLTEHLKSHPNDTHTGYGLTKMVSRRRNLMKYLKREDIQRYLDLIKQLEIRG